ncbi:DUF1878 family protein [Virgibacillus sp. YIM 98842]|uniref:DUF1878 family protein n=1 Tax=Virgibacillus sp. YIM 98842 TaxID=2663533 RepID=UPI0013DAAF7C|nr:DUF1878 family protein [Virgibacillus sp. YIM 98842]
MKEPKDETASFHVQLLSKILNLDDYPVVKLIIENNLSKEESEELFLLLNKLNDQYERQKEEGFLDFTPLLVEYAGMLNEKLDPDNTIAALRQEGHYPDLMREFSKIIDMDKRKSQRRS